jgi:sialate O-acetylesterase
MPTRSSSSLAKFVQRALPLAVFAAMFAPVVGQSPDDQDLRFARIFTDNMVFQQGKKTRVWGFGKSAQRVVVTITQDPAVARPHLPEVKAPKSGGYQVRTRYVEENAPKFDAQTRQAVADTDGAWQVEFDAMPAGFAPKYVVAKVGDRGVAIQNVLIGEIWVCAGQSNMGWGGFNRKDREVASSDFPGLRYVAWEDSWYKPLDDVRKKIQWKECTPQNAQRFSAVPYLYGSFLHRYLKVPVGIINVARGGTLGQTWCLREELEGVDNKIVKTVLRDYDAETAIWDDPKKVERLMAEWRKACDAKRSEHDKKIATASAAGDTKKQPRLRLPKKPGDPRAGWSPPAGLFNATVMPIRKLGIRGVLYYQGENQAFQRWTRYEYTFPKVPVSFRKAFGDPNLPFGCISQPGWGNYGTDPEVSAVSGGYHVVRDIQRRALAGDPHADMIATYPTGNSYIHPAEKWPVAEYASRWALAKVYNKPIVHRGSTYRELKIKGPKAYAFFDTDPIVYERWKHIEKNAYWQVLPCPREGNAEFRGFIIAGADQRWFPAKGRHTRLDGVPCIELHNDLVTEPVAIRYGWAQWPIGNMVGRERLPMPTFRTDDWPLPIGANYSEEAKEHTKLRLQEAKVVAERQALDRKIRQMQIDTARFEKDLHLRKGKGSQPLVQSKLDRIETILDELQKDRWLGGQLRGQPALVKQIESLREALEAAKVRSAEMQGKK